MESSWRYEDAHRASACRPPAGCRRRSVCASGDSDCGRRHGAGIACARSRACAAMSGACRRDRGSCSKERSTISARSLKASLATPDNSRVRLLEDCPTGRPRRRASAQNLSAWARRSASSRISFVEAPLRPTVSDSPCRSHIRPGFGRRCWRPPPRDSPWPPPAKGASSPSSAKGVARRPPPRRCPDPPACARACRP